MSSLSKNIFNHNNRKSSIVYISMNANKCLMISDQYKVNKNKHDNQRQGFYHCLSIIWLNFSIDTIVFK